MSIRTTMKSAQTVYYGPGTSKYPSAGSVSKSEAITALWTESTWCYIEYQVTGTSNKKRGYVPKTSVTSTTGLTTISGHQSSGSKPGDRSVYSGCTVYFGPNPNTYPSAGSVSTGEIVNYLGVKENGNQYAFIEYELDGSTSSKRGWVYANNLRELPEVPDPPAGYETFKENDIIPNKYPYGGSTVTQGWNDKRTDHKGHLGYDIVVPNSIIKPLFTGTVVGVKKTTGTANGRAVCVSHNINGIRFYTTYCHLKSVEENIMGTTVTTSTKLGEMGGSGKKENSYSPHVHVCVYTGTATTDPSGYCADDQETPFESVAPTFMYEPYYYGPDESKFPRCRNVCFYDPFGVVSTNAEIIRRFP